MFTYFIMAMVTVVIFILMSVLKKVLVDDITSFIPTLCQIIIRRAADKLNHESRDEYCEAWLADLNDTPALSIKIYNALSLYLWGAHALSKQLRSNSIDKVMFDTLKRWLDLCVVVTAAPLTLIICIVLAILLWLDGDPVFVEQEVIGKNNHPYRIRKFRTLRIKSDIALEKHLRENTDAMEEWLRTGRLQDDPRIRDYCSFIRRYSLDELPLLWSVVKGDMSLVGPRYMTHEQFKNYNGRHYAKLRPGITGAWQTSDLLTPNEDSRGNDDDDYFENRSFKRDIDILYRSCLVAMKMLLDWSRKFFGFD